MIRFSYFLIFLSVLSFKAFAFEPYSGISCQNLKSKNVAEFFFKNNENFIYATVYKRIHGEFKNIGNVVGQKISSFILFEDKTVDENLNFAWHLDMVTKNLKPFILTDNGKNKFKMPVTLDCISKNFWF